MHSLRHTAAMRLLHAGVDTAVIALWLAHETVDTTQVYLHADLALKEQRALARASRPERKSPFGLAETPRFCPFRASCWLHGARLLSARNGGRWPRCLPRGLVNEAGGRNLWVRALAGRRSRPHGSLGETPQRSDVIFVLAAAPE